MDRKDATARASFRDFEHAGWQMVAEPYHDYFSGLTVQAIDALLDAVALSPGDSLLDIASGPGYVAAAAAARGARVTGVDFSSVMVAKARAAHPSIEFVEGDAEALAFAPGSFDAVVMNFGLLHLGEPEQALAEAHRVLRAGGRFAFSVWAPPELAAAFAIVLEAVRTHGDPDVALPPGPPFFRFSDEEESERALLAAGFRSPSMRTVSMSWCLPSPAAVFEAFLHGTPRTGGLLRAQSPANLKAIAGAVAAAAAEYAAAGGIRIPMASRVVSAVK